MVSSVLNEGARGLQLSQREMLKSAQEIARANVSERPTAENAVRAQEETVIPPVEALENTSPQRDISEPLIELRRQEQLFTANAKVISVANETIGSLIDVKS